MLIDLESVTLTEICWLGARADLNALKFLGFEALIVVRVVGGKIST